MLNLWKYVLTVSLIIIMACDDNFAWEPCNTPIERIEPYPVIVDTNCSMRERGSVFEAIESINEMASSLVCQPVLKFAGYVDIDHSEPTIPNNGTLACYTREPEWFDDLRLPENIIGLGKHNSWVKLFVFKRPLMTQDLSLALTIHELGHYIGLHHTDNYNAMMYPNANELNISPSSEDGKMFCGVYNCVD